MFGFRRSAVQIVIFLVWGWEYCTFGSLVLWYLFAVGSFVSSMLALLTYDYDYWLRRGVFSPPAWPLVGHIKSVVAFKEQGGMCFKRIYDQYKHLRFLGTHQFFQRTLVVCEPALIRRVCVADFQHFVDRGFFFNKDVDPLAGSVLFLRGNEWKKLRTKISPIFSPNKLRGMLPLIENTANEFVEKVTAFLSKQELDEHGEPKIECRDCNQNIGSKDVDTEKLVGGYTADAIVPCAFGLKSNVMDNDDDPFAVALQAFYDTSWYNLLEKTMRQFWPTFVLFFRMRIIPKKTHDFFYNIVTSVLRARENGEQEKRGDFIDMMMSLRSDDVNNNARCEDDVEITDMVISANAFIIFLGGFETTSSTLAFLLLELAHDERAQRRLRREVRDLRARSPGPLTYDMLNELPYMDMVIQETLRLYPPFPSIQRLCTKDYVIPDSGGIVVEKGTVVLFPTLAIQRDSQYFPDGDSFTPERWAEGSAPPPPGVYMPFGDGPRYCIGKRFAMIQMKCCLVRLLAHVAVSPAPGAPPRRAPFPADPRSPLTLHPLDSKLTFSIIK